MANDAARPMYPYEALKIIEVLLDVAEAGDNPGADNLILREIRNVLAMALPKKPRRRRPKA